MMNLPISLEFYPKLSTEILKKAATIINENKKNWEAPFFMDVYRYADIEEFKQICQPYLDDPKLENLILLGTGGSYQTMKGLALFSKKNLYFLTSSRPNELSDVLSLTNPENSLVVPISRGGKTLDVNSILPLFKEYNILALSSQGPMNDLVKKLNATIIPVPDLSGRFAASICSVGLVPMLLAGMDIQEFQKGLEDGYSVFKDLNTFEHNICLQYAVFLEKLYRKNYRNIFSMPYSEWLEGLVGLFVQEVSESSGKEGFGFLGTYQPAPLCQHSVLELLLGGSKGHTTPLMWTTMKEPTDVVLDAMESSLDGQTGLSVINYQLDATFQALIEQGIPAGKISLEEISLYSMGSLIAFIQTTVYYYCMLTNVNWSSNPLVNTGKKICNDALEKKLNSAERIQIREEIAQNRFQNYFQ